MLYVRSYSKILTLAFDKAVIYGDVALSEVVFSTQKIFKKGFCIGKSSFRVKGLKILKISICSYIKIRQPHKRKTISKIPMTAF